MSTATSTPHGPQRSTDYRRRALTDTAAPDASRLPAHGCRTRAQEVAAPSRRAHDAALRRRDAVHPGRHVAAGVPRAALPGQAAAACCSSSRPGSSCGSAWSRCPRPSTETWTRPRATSRSTAPSSSSFSRSSRGATCGAPTCAQAETGGDEHPHTPHRRRPASPGRGPGQEAANAATKQSAEAAGNPLDAISWPVRTDRLTLRTSDPRRPRGHLGLPPARRRQPVADPRTGHVGGVPAPASKTPPVSPRPSSSSSTGCHR